MTPKFSNLDIPALQSQAADWALEFNEIKKITLHCSKLNQEERVPPYGIFIWVTKKVNTDLLPWLEQMKTKDGKILTRVRKKYMDRDGKLDAEKVAGHPLYKFWKLIWKLQNPINLEDFEQFYKKEFLDTEIIKSREHRFHWLVIPVNEGDEADFRPSGTWHEWKNDEFGSIQLFPKEAEAPRAKTSDLNPEDFIQKLQLSHGGDSSVFITAPGKKPKEFSCKEIGFGDNEKGWQLLMDLLQNKVYQLGVYSLGGNASKKKDYYRRRQRLYHFSQKFISFLNKEFQAGVPSLFSLFENQKGLEIAGTYKPKFQIYDQKRVANLKDIRGISKDETLMKLESLSQETKREKNEEKRNQLLNELGLYAEHAVKNGWINKQQLSLLLSLDDEEPDPSDALYDAASPPPY